METFELVCHPGTPSKADLRCEVQVSWQPGRGSFHYHLTGEVDRVAFAERAEFPHASDGLWRTTCMEAFVAEGEGPGYVEFNFAPSGNWAAYAFTDYREGMTGLAADVNFGDAAIVMHREARIEVTVQCPDRDPFKAGARLALCAVIEELDGTRSYWAVAHPPGRPDFHHPACFAATLSAPHGP